MQSILHARTNVVTERPRTMRDLPNVARPFGLGLIYSGVVQPACHQRVYKPFDLLLSLGTREMCRNNTSIWRLTSRCSSGAVPLVGASVWEHIYYGAVHPRDILYGADHALLPLGASYASTKEHFFGQKGPQGTARLVAIYSSVVISTAR